MNRSTMKTNNLKLLLVTTIATVFFGFGNSDLVVIPRDTVAVVGQTAYFNCSTNAVQNPKVQWHYNNDDHIYAGGKFLSRYERFRMEIHVDNSTASYNLVIPNVKRDDAGRYRCLDNEGFGDKSSAELVVLDGNPVCRSDTKENRIVGPNDCNIDPEAVRLSCSATYNGNIPPILKWARLGSSSPISMDRTMCRNSTNRVDCNLTITPDQLQLSGSTYMYVCHTEQTTNINCTSESIDMIYSFNDFLVTERSINDELSCKVNSSEQCINRWIWNAVNSSRKTLYDNSTITAGISGLYRCESECNIRGKRCTVSSVLVYIPSDSKTAIIDAEMEYPELGASSNPASQNTVLTIVLAILVVLLAVCVVSLLVCCIRWRKFNKEKQQNKPNTSAIPLLTHTSTDNQENHHEEQKETHDGSYDECDGPGQHSEHEDPLTLQVTENERLRSELETSKAESEELRKQLNDRESEWLKQKDELNSEVDVLKKQKAVLEDKIKRLVERNCELGRSLCVPPKDPIEYKVEPHKSIKTLASQGPKKLGVCGLAVLETELFVISDAHPEIEVYDMSTFKYIRKIQLLDVKDPGDIVACKKNKRIYIVDWTGRNVENKLLRLDVTGKEDTPRRYLADDECRLFVTRESNVLVTFYRNRRIVEYSPEGDTVFQTNIKGDRVHPIHSIKLSNGLLVICYAIANEPTHKVSIVSDDGSILKSFGGRRVGDVGNVNFPTYLAVDRSDNILVADRDNVRVLVLNSRLELTVELLTKQEELRRPRVLLLDEANSRLAVADCSDKFEDGQVLIFNLK